MSGTTSAGLLVRLEMRGQVAVVWLDDTQRRNALSTQLTLDLIEALALSRQEGARAVVLASKQKGFCAGADIRDMLESRWLEATSLHDTRTPPDLFEAIEADPRLIVVAVDGFAIGGGVELCLVCDLVVAGNGASFMFPELGLGVLPNTAIARLPRMVGLRAAAELIFTRRRIDAAEALRLGLVSTLAGDEGAVERAVMLAQAICSSVPPTALTAAKRNLARGLEWAGIHAMLADMDSAEWREGTAAFVEKRTPDYEPFWRKLRQPSG